MADLADREWRRTWRIITWAGFLGGGYYIICIAGAPWVKYFTALGATPFDFGLLATLASVSLVFQLVGSMLSNRLTRRKPLWLAVASAHRLLFVAVLFAPWIPGSASTRVWWVLLALLLHHCLAQISVPIWLSWMADLVPKETMSRHWAGRQRIITAATIMVMVLIAVGFHWFEVTGRVVLGFTLLGAVGVLCGVIDILMFLAVPEPEHERVHDVPWRRILVQPLMDRDYRRFLAFMGYWHFAVFLAAPFFGLYLLEDLGYSARTVQLLGTAAALGVVLCSRFWGLICDVYGFRPVLQILTLTKIVTPLAYLAAPRSPEYGLPWFCVVWFIDGCINSGMALATQGPLLKLTPQRNRTMYIAVANFMAIGVMASIAPALSGYLIKTVNSLEAGQGFLAQTNGYHVAFALSLVMRMGAFVLAGRIVDPAAGPLPTVVRQVCSINSMRASRWSHILHDGKTPEKRIRAARVLGGLRNPLAISELAQALRDPSAEVREAVAEALEAIGSTDAAGVLVDALFDTKSGVKSPAVRALGRLGGVDSLRGLLRYLQSRDPEALWETVDALGRIGDEAAVLPLLCLFNDTGDEALRARVAQVLASLTQADSWEEVMDLLHGRRPLSQQIIK